MNKTDRFTRLFPVMVTLCVIAGVVSCSTAKKLEQIRAKDIAAQINLPEDKEVDFRDIDATVSHDDTLVVYDDEGNAEYIMKAIKDEETGEMVANEQIDAAVVTARFRNVAERNGKIDLEFQIKVPKELRDSKWQLRFNPDMFILEDSLRLESVIVTGADYRKAQLKGYQQYEKWLKSIIGDDDVFINKFLLENWLSRNIPQIYQFKFSEDYVDDEVFLSYYGVTEKQAVEHYTNKLRKAINEKKKASKQRMFHKFVKAPYITENLRLDTVMVDNNGDFIYNYIQTIMTRPKLRKVDIVLSGDIFEMDKRVYRIPATEPLTFYISSVSSFTEMKEKYLTKIISRHVEANAQYFIDFEKGRADIKENLYNNATEIARIKKNLAQLMENETFDLDSIVVTSFASPEGSNSVNSSLCQRRSEAVSRYFANYIRHYSDSLRRYSGFTVDMTADGAVTHREEVAPIRFISRNGGENWERLNKIISDDETLTDEQKEKYYALTDVKDVDARENRIKSEGFYNYIRDDIYPRLRTVTFNFNLHRKGMVEEEVETTVLDTVYMRGLQALQDRDYKTASTLLRPYNDFNAAIAFTAMDANNSALAILENLPRNAKVNYLLAILYSRKGRDAEAVQCYRNACKMDGTYVHRGNLDPEISALIKTYGLNKQDDDEFEYDL